MLVMSYYSQNNPTADWLILLWMHNKNREHFWSNFTSNVISAWGWPKMGQRGAVSTDTYVFLNIIGMSPSVPPGFTECLKTIFKWTSQEFMTDNYRFLHLDLKPKFKASMLRLKQWGTKRQQRQRWIEALEATEKRYARAQVLLFNALI